MKILVATRTGQGVRDNDFFHAREGEPVLLGVVCDRDLREGPDGGCGCARGFSGARSRKGTTTALVSETSKTRAEYAEELGMLEGAAWPNLSPSTIRARVREALALADLHDAGTILERRGSVVRVRKPARKCS